ncbi:putative serine/threonine-protein kinase [Vitis vinifera]|uniref:Putative serine/threonine-protein kinase n=1 Tax=Vitis vinifera TaxID=29760 RepID=A0A438H4N8_VITVI|nr:putative serine/threonine-protein kinase [Vitis vinifera]
MMVGGGCLVVEGSFMLWVDMVAIQWLVVNNGKDASVSGGASIGGDGGVGSCGLYRMWAVKNFESMPPFFLFNYSVGPATNQNPADRGSAAFALKSEFFTVKPLPCDPSSLPKYPPSKEFDAKYEMKKLRRQGAAGKGQRLDHERKGIRESRAVPAPDANAELVLSMQKRQGQSNSKSRSEKFNPHPEEVASGFPIDPPRPSQAIEDGSIDTQGPLHKRASHSGPLAHRAVWAKAGKNLDDAPKVSTGADLSTLSSLVAARRSLLSEDRREKSGSSQPDVSKLIVRFPGSFKEASESTIQQIRSIKCRVPADVTQKEDGRMTSKDPVLLGYGSKGHKIHYSGPLLVPSGKVDQMLKDHDRQIQDAERRARLDREKLRKVQVEGNKISANSLFVSGR